MKRSWVVLLLLVGLAMPAASHAQVSAYGEFSGADLHNLASQDTLYGASAGVLVDGPQISRFVISGDVQGRFVGKSGESLNGITVGPRISIPLKAHGLTPYGEFMVGFARYNNPKNFGATTDATIQVNGGISKRVSPHWDVTGEYSYSQYYALGGEYNPKTFSVGGVYHFVKR